MVGFRILLVVMFAVLAAYSGVVMSTHGLNLLQVFFADMGHVAWPGQFNLDFTMMLTFSALWVAWRHRFTLAGLGLAVLAFFGGSLFLTVYLLVISIQAGGRVDEILVGRTSASLSSTSRS